MFSERRAKENPHTRGGALCVGFLKSRAVATIADSANPPTHPKIKLLGFRVTPPNPPQGGLLQLKKRHAKAIQTIKQNTKQHDSTRSHMPDKSGIGQGKGPARKAIAIRTRKQNTKHDSTRSHMPDKSEIGQGKGLDQFQPESKIQKT